MQPDKAQKRAPTEKHERRSLVLGVLLAFIFFAIFSVVSIVLLFAGSGSIRNLLLIFIFWGAVLSPLIGLLIVRLRPSRPHIRRDPVTLAAATLCIAMLLLRLVDISLAIESTLAAMLVSLGLTAIILPLSSAVAVFDVFRFRSPILATILLLTLIVFSLPHPHTAFARNKDCLLETIGQVNLDIQTHGRNSRFYFSNHESGSCGQIRWTQILANSDDGTIQLKSAGGALDYSGGHGYLWRDGGIDNCRDQSSLYLCNSIKQLDDNWSYYTREISFN